ncbi:protein IAA-LEUCINE RESISTANT 2, partial [Trifolium medium]|nr:protein IAA-LEUCINE RESISTANT 2 [Trifolium medium]
RPEHIASQPENSDFGLVSPTIVTFRPTRRSSFVPANTMSIYGMPNIPGIIALIEDLKESFDAGVFPSHGQHIPVDAEATIFSTTTFPAEAGRNARLRWSLVTPGIEHPCEAGTQLHRTFADHIEDFSYPDPVVADPINRLEYFLSFHTGFAWFGVVRDVAAAISSFYHGSRTLTDCPVAGYNHNQYLIYYSGTDLVLPFPTRIADSRSLFPLSFHVETSVREEQRANLHIAASVQTNVVFPENHPAASTFGQQGVTRFGPFWDVWPTTSTVF